MKRVRDAMPAVKQREDGFSLPELILAMGLFAILMTLVVTVFTTFNNRFTQERSATDSATVASIGMNELTKVLRSGTILTRKDADPQPIFISATRDSVEFYGYLAEDAFLNDNTLGVEPIRIRFSVVNGILKEQRWGMVRQTTTRNWINGSATPIMDRVVARKIIAPTTAEVAAGGKYLFTYLKADGTPLTAPVAADSLKLIVAVQVTMKVQADITERADPVQIQNRVGLPNLTSSRLGSSG